MNAFSSVIAWALYPALPTITRRLRLYLHLREMLGTRGSITAFARDLVVEPSAPLRRHALHVQLGC